MKGTTNKNKTWYPTNENSLQGFWEYKRCSLISGNTDVAALGTWFDTSHHARDMVQATASEKVSYTHATGAVNFDGDDNLQMASGEIAISGAFTVALVGYFVALSNEVLLASNTTANQFIRLNDGDAMNIKIDSANTITFNLSGGLVTNTVYNLMICRDSSDLITIWLNGVKQTDTATGAGTLRIDTLGVRYTDLNDLTGRLYEVVVFNDFSTTLASNVSTRLNEIKNHI